MHEVFEHTRTIKRSEDKIRGYGSAIITRSPIIEQTSTTLRDDRFSYMTSHPENKRVLLSVRTQDEPDIVVNTAHLSYSLPLNIGKKGMRSECQSLAAILKQQKEQFGVVFGGDMNVKPGKALDALLSSIGLKSVLQDIMPTFRSRHWFAGHIKRNLDRVFVGAGLKASGYVGDRRQSDHNPVIVEIVKNS